MLECLNVLWGACKQLFIVLTEYSNCENHPCRPELEEGVGKLQNDADRDVRFYSSPDAYVETPAYSDDGNNVNDYQVWYGDVSYTPMWD